MADDFHWAERQRFLTSFCLVASSVHSARRCQPSRVIFLRHRSCRLFPLVEGILGSRLDEGCRVPAAMERRRNTVGEGGRISRRTCGLQSVFTSSMGCHHSALPSREKSAQAISKERRTRRCLNGFLISQLDSVCRSYSATTRLRWLASLNTWWEVND